MNSYYKNWQTELDAFLIYKVLASIEKENRKGPLFEKLSQESLHQSKIWKNLTNNETLNWDYKPSLKIRIIAMMLKKIGPKYLIDFLPSLKIRGLSLYRLGDDHHNQDQLEMESVHSKIKSGSNLRAAIFGINDGLVSNASLVFAMVGAQSENQTLILTGVAGLLAGGFSMATGEYVSVKSQTELFENQIAIEREELQEFPEEEAKELSLIYQAKGIDRETANKIATTLVLDKEKALDTLAREELGLNPNDLSSPIQAAFASFFSFAIGAGLPLLPFIVMGRDTAVTTSFILSLSTLFIIGLLISLLTGKSALMSGLRMCALGLFSGTITYLIGSVIGVSVN